MADDNTQEPSRPSKRIRRYGSQLTLDRTTTVFHGICSYALSNCRREGRLITTNSPHLLHLMTMPRLSMRATIRPQSQRRSRSGEAGIAGSFIGSAETACPLFIYDEGDGRLLTLPLFWSVQFLYLLLAERMLNLAFRRFAEMPKCPVHQ